MSLGNNFKNKLQIASNKQYQLTSCLSNNFVVALYTIFISSIINNKQRSLKPDQRGSINSVWRVFFLENFSYNWEITTNQPDMTSRCWKRKSNQSWSTYTWKKLNSSSLTSFTDTDRIMASSLLQ